MSSVETPGYRFLGYSGTMKLTPDRITDYKAPTAEEASDAKRRSAHRSSIIRGRVPGNDKSRVGEITR
nr:hypothetical protein [Klebsiella pneumoniae subsp. pneumoniae]